MNNIEQIKNELTKANELYRKGMSSGLTDQQYDDKLDELQSLIDSDEYEVFRSTLFEEAGKFKHKFIIGSLRKMKAENASLSKWLKRQGGTIFHVSSKIDGISMVLGYTDGKLKYASTRGDGVYGENHISKIKYIVPNFIDGFTGTIRGEVTLIKETFDDACEYAGTPFKNLRNATTGIVGRDVVNVDLVKCLRFYAYRVMESDESIGIQFDKLSNLGFALPKSTTLDTAISGVGNDVITLMVEQYNEFKESEVFDIDGLVIHSETETVENVKLPTNTIALKINDLIAETELLGIDWQLSMSGKLVPVGVISPVELGGAMISRVTLFHYKFVNDHEFEYGSKLTIMKSGDIIPIVTHINGVSVN